MEEQGAHTGNSWADWPTCHTCGMPAVKNGRSRHGKQRWRCPYCGRQFVANPGGRVDPKVAEIAERMIQAKMAPALIAELCQVSRSWVYRRMNRLEGTRGA